MDPTQEKLNITLSLYTDVYFTTSLEFFRIHLCSGFFSLNTVSSVT